MDKEKVKAAGSTAAKEEVGGDGLASVNIIPHSGNGVKPFTVPLPLEIEQPEEPLSLGQLFRLRDALIVLEQRIGKARLNFEGALAEILKEGQANG